jgi:predicted outer membrane protein
VLGLVLVPALVMAAGSRRAEPKTGWWPEVMERTFSDALSFSQEMMARVHYSNQLAAELGRLAEVKTASPEVRRFGRLIAADRQLEDKQMLEYASHRMGVALGPPQFVMESERDLVMQRMARFDYLKTVAGPDFDTEFLALALADNQTDFELIDHAATQVDDPTLRIMFDQMIPILEQHEIIMQALRSQGARSTVGR